MRNERKLAVGPGAGDSQFFLFLPDEKYCSFSGGYDILNYIRKREVVW